MIQRSKLGLKFFSQAFSTPCLSSGPVNRSDACRVTCAEGLRTISANVLKCQMNRALVLWLEISEQLLW